MAHGDKAVVHVRRIPSCMQIDIGDWEAIWPEKNVDNSGRSEHGAFEQPAFERALGRQGEARNRDRIQGVWRRWVRLGGNS